MLRYKIAPKCLLSGPFGHSGVGGNPGVVGTVRSYNLVFTYPCQDEDPPGEIYWEPVLVWTGSYNPSRLAPRSRENAVIIRDPDIAGAYQQEWCQIMSLSEAIDSRVDQINPEWGLGTS